MHMGNETTFLVFYRFRPLDSEEKSIAKHKWDEIKSSLPKDIALIGEYDHAWGTEYNGFLMFQSNTSDQFFEWWSTFKDEIRWYVEKTHTIVARKR